MPHPDYQSKSMPAIRYLLSLLESQWREDLRSADTSRNVGQVLKVRIRSLVDIGEIPALNATAATPGRPGTEITAQKKRGNDYDKRTTRNTGEGHQRVAG